MRFCLRKISNNSFPPQKVARIIYLYQIYYLLPGHRLTWLSRRINHPHNFTLPYLPQLWYFPLILIFCIDISHANPKKLLQLFIKNTFEEHLTNILVHHVGATLHGSEGRMDSKKIKTLDPQ